MGTANAACGVLSNKALMSNNKVSDPSLLTSASL